MPESRKPLTYAESGVDIDTGNRIVDRIRPLARATRRLGASAELGGFGGLFDLRAAGFVDPILVAANDGVGTKLKIAAESGVYDTIGIDLVAMCVNDIVVQGAEPLFFLDYFAAGKLDEDVVSAVLRGVAEGCAQSGCALIGGETAEMPGVYAPGDFDIAGFAVGAAERGTLLPRPGLKAGDVVYGLPSSAFIRTVFRWCGASSRGPASVGTLPPRSTRRARSPRRCCRRRAFTCGRCFRRWRGREAFTRSPTSPAGAIRIICRACSTTAWPSRSISTRSRRRLSFHGSRRPAISMKRRCCGPSIAASGWPRSFPPTTSKRRAGLSRARACRRS